jgi:hypothetical protein
VFESSITITLMPESGLPPGVSLPIGALYGPPRCRYARRARNGAAALHGMLAACGAAPDPKRVCHGPGGLPRA